MLDIEPPKKGQSHRNDTPDECRQHCILGNRKRPHHTAGIGGQKSRAPTDLRTQPRPLTEDTVAAQAPLFVAVGTTVAAAMVVVVKVVWWAVAVVVPVVEAPEGEVLEVGVLAAVAPAAGMTVAEARVTVELEVGSQVGVRAE